ncbi:MAG: glycoside hydrolase family 15 protein [Brevibacillus sp.]|nr:glycoside hydrolase family 15 protein [Brevibacillus sp.]
MISKNTADCVRHSVDIIRQNQAGTGAYIASPGFVHYRYAWFRDGTFTAYAMDRIGEHESARRFYQWCHDVLMKQEPKARRAMEAARRGEWDGHENDVFLHTRYTVDGEEVPGKWGNFQLDGYGTWLWGVAEHVRLTGQTAWIDQMRPGIELTLDYLEACWRLPNYDCWEEHGDRIHPATLAAVYGGCRAVQPYLPDRSAALGALCEEIRLYLLKNGIEQGRFVKSIGNPAVDASLLWLSLPFGMVAIDDPVMTNTVHQIERLLQNGCGVHRYPQDVYYGGGQWPLLSAWLGWYYARAGKRPKAVEMLRWVESKFGGEGLPEQVQDVLLAPAAYQEWLSKEGPPAVPLLWSHAMYLVLYAELVQWPPLSEKR